jgi:hypothetical protein
MQTCPLDQRGTRPVLLALQVSCPCRQAVQHLCMKRILSMAWMLRQHMLQAQSPCAHHTQPAPHQQCLTTRSAVPRHTMPQEAPAPCLLVPKTVSQHSTITALSHTTCPSIILGYPKPLDTWINSVYPTRHHQQVLADNLVSSRPLPISRHKS